MKVRLDMTTVYLCDRVRCNQPLVQNTQHVHMLYCGWVALPELPEVEYKVEELRVWELCYN
jgi:hypothetical protein